MCSWVHFFVIFFAIAGNNNRRFWSKVKKCWAFPTGTLISKLGLRNWVFFIDKKRENPNFLSVHQTISKPLPFLRFAFFSLLFRSTARLR